MHRFKQQNCQAILNFDRACTYRDDAVTMTNTSPVWRLKVDILHIGKVMVNDFQCPLRIWVLSIERKPMLCNLYYICCCRVPFSGRTKAMIVIHDCIVACSCTWIWSHTKAFLDFARHQFRIHRGLLLRLAASQAPKCLNHLDLLTGPGNIPDLQKSCFKNGSKHHGRPRSRRAWYEGTRQFASTKSSIGCYLILACTIPGGRNAHVAGS